MSSTHKRAVLGYPNILQYKMFIGYASWEGLTKSKALNIIMKDFFERRNKDKRDIYRKAGEDIFAARATNKIMVTI